MAKTIGQLEESLFAENDGSSFSKTKNELIKRYGETDRERVLAVLTRYSKSGRLLHWRNFLLTDVIALVHENERAFAPFFEWAITQPQLTYWAIDGLLKTKGKAAYQPLVELAQAENLPTDVRAKAIKGMAVYSRQPFDRNLPTDPGYWEPKDFRLQELLEWQRQGYSQGTGYAEPRIHPSLRRPQTELQKAVAALDKKLEAKRKKHQDLSNPSNWLAVADENKMAEIKRKWTLPQNYLAFLTAYSPVNVFIDNEKFFQGLRLYGAEALVASQAGYSFNPVTGETIEDWPPGYVVIGDAGGDPYCIDTGNIKDGDAPVYTSLHGEGEWKFEKYADSFVDFLKGIAEERQRR